LHSSVTLSLCSFGICGLRSIGGLYLL
jgi:hypothetical protein